MVSEAIRNRGRLALLLSGLAACSSPASLTDASVPTVLPSLIEWTVVTGPESWRGHGGMAVSPRGVLAFTISGKDADPRFAYLDSAGKTLGTFSRTGDGPGEVRAIGGLWFDGDTLGSFDLMAQRAIRFDREGRTLAMIQIAGIGQPAGMGSAGMVTILLGEKGPEIVALDAEGDEAELIERQDAAYDSIVRAPFREIGEEDRMPLPAVAVRGSTIAFADAWTYRVAWARGGRVFARYGDDGTPHLPTSAEVSAQRRSLEGWRGPNGKKMDPAAIERMVAHFATTAVPRFDRRPGFGMAFDGQGRLWVARELVDSVAWDILAPGRLLGTLTLPCAGGSNRGRSVNGGFLAMECEAETDTVPVIRIWRIDG